MVSKMLLLQVMLLALLQIPQSNTLMGYITRVPPQQQQLLLLQLLLLLTWTSSRCLSPPKAFLTLGLVQPVSSSNLFCNSSDYNMYKVVGFTLLSTYDGWGCRQQVHGRIWVLLR